uniref:Uncharacterized protein n=1 Tax=Anguilla anguilla TaxID=7936 RepID=A0A0E9XCI5_ANGAN
MLGFHAVISIVLDRPPRESVHSRAFGILRVTID